MDYKLHHSQKEVAARKRRIGLMRVDQRRAHEQWQRTHKPGPAKARAAERERRRQDRDARASILRAQLEIAIREGRGVFG
ncbi:hypothetical protein [Mesorhizobium marinum]|uniref:hypothetical protein n=1 Tax=Mesorhizobium marinum TaxID=3228790 RepID=UPI003467BBB5